MLLSKQLLTYSQFRLYIISKYIHYMKVQLIDLAFNKNSNEH